MTLNKSDFGGLLEVKEIIEKKLKVWYRGKDFEEFLCKMDTFCHGKQNF